MLFFQVDGDTDTTPVQDDFKSVVKDHIDYIKEHSTQLMTPPQHQGFPNGHFGGLPNGTGNGNNVSNGIVGNGHIANGHVRREEAELLDLEDEPINTISKHVQNGVNHMGNGVKHMSNGNGPQKQMGNGFAGNPKYASLDAERRENIRNMYQDQVPVNNHI